MNKKILAILALLIFATSITAVSAFDLGSLFGGEQNETVTIEGIKFNIPAGYEEDASNFSDTLVAPIKELGGNMSAKGYVNDNTGVEIVVADYSKLDLTDEAALSTTDGNATKINGVDGLLNHDKDYYFTFTKDKHLVIMTSNDQKAFADFIIA